MPVTTQAPSHPFPTEVPAKCMHSPHTREGSAWPWRNTILLTGWRLRKPDWAHWAPLFLNILSTSWSLLCPDVSCILNQGSISPSLDTKMHIGNCKPSSVPGIWSRAARDETEPSGRFQLTEDHRVSQSPENKCSFKSSGELKSCGSMGWCLDSGSQLGRGSENWLESQTSGSPNSCVWTGKSDGAQISH